MYYVIFGLSAFMVGFIAAIPVGANQVEVARRAINGYFSSAMMVVAGGTLSDLIYGLIAFFGVRSFLRDPLVASIFWLVNGAILIGLGIYTIRHSKVSDGKDQKAARSLKNHRVALVTGFTLAIMNPLMISWWLIGADLLEDAGVMEQGTKWELWFLCIAAIGLASYSVLLAFIGRRVKRSISHDTVRKITVVFGVLLICIAGYFIGRSILTLSNPHKRQAKTVTFYDEASVPGIMARFAAAGDCPSPRGESLIV